MVRKQFIAAPNNVNMPIISCNQLSHKLKSNRQLSMSKDVNVAGMGKTTFRLEMRCILATVPSEESSHFKRQSVGSKSNSSRIPRLSDLP